MQNSEHPFHTFIDLINFDQTILAREKAIASDKDALAALTREEQQLSLQLEAKKNAMMSARKIVDEHELELKALDAQEKQKKERLENATDYKHYQSLKIEVDALKLKQHNYDEVLMTAWNILEATQKEYEATKEEYPKKMADLDAQKIKKNESLAALQQELRNLEEQRKIKEQGVPAEWLEKYAMMRSRVQDPVVPVELGNCTACFYKVTEQDLMQLRRRALLQCKGCYRLLYSPELATEGK